MLNPTSSRLLLAFVLVAITACGIARAKLTDIEPHDPNYCAVCVCRRKAPECPIIDNKPVCTLGEIRNMRARGQIERCGSTTLYRYYPELHYEVVWAFDTKTGELLAWMGGGFYGKECLQNYWTAWQMQPAGFVFPKPETCTPENDVRSKPAVTNQ